MAKMSAALRNEPMLAGATPCTNVTRYLLAACLALGLLGCTPESAHTEAHLVATATARGAGILAPLKQELKQALLAGLQEGPVHAIRVCRDQAPAIAASLSVDGIEIGRTSHRLRNPANVAPGWANTVLQSYLSESADRTPVTVSLPGAREGYVEPIVLQPLCVACHGTSLAPDVAAQIKEAYPEDAATGFEIGDLRGIYWVEYAASKM